MVRISISKPNQVKIKNCQIMERLILILILILIDMLNMLIFDIVICLAKEGEPFGGRD